MRVVKARVVKQFNLESGEVNLTITTDPLTPLEDFAVEGGSWKNHPPVAGELIIIGDELMVQDLVDREFRSVSI